MSEYTPTTDEAFNATLYTWVDWKGVFASEEEAADAWVRMIAEVERAAAEKALTDFADELAEKLKAESAAHAHITQYREGIIDGINRGAIAARRRAGAYRRAEKEERDD